MKEIYPEYSERVAFFAVGTDPGEELEVMEAYRLREDHPWPVAQPVGSMLRKFQVFQQSTKLAFDANGVIIYREGYRQGNEDTWRRVFEELAASQPS